MTNLERIGVPKIVSPPGGSLRLRWDAERRLYVPEETPPEPSGKRPGPRGAPPAPPPRPRSALAPGLVLVAAACLLAVAILDPPPGAPTWIADMPRLETRTAAALPGSPADPEPPSTGTPLEPPDSCPPLVPVSRPLAPTWSWEPPAGATGPSAIAELIRQAKDWNDWNEVTNLLLHLARLEPENGVLDSLLADTSPRLVVAAIGCFRAAGATRRLVPSLLEAAETSPDRDVRAAAIRAAAEADLSASRETLLALVASDPDPRVRSAAAMALRGVPGLDAGEALAAAYLAEPDPGVVGVIAGAITDGRDPWAARRLLDAAGRFQAGDPHLRAALEIFAATLPAAESVPVVSGAIRSDPDPWAQARAVATLGQIPDPSAATELAAIYREERDPLVRTSILVALGAIPGAGARELLAEEASNGPDAETRDLASRLLAARRPPIGIH